MISGGYVSGNLDQPVNTVLASMKGPIKGRNWFSTNNPAFSITISPGAAGAVALEGTNDSAIRQGGSCEMDDLPTDGATWTPIQGSTSTSQAGSFTVEYKFLRLVVKTRGAGNVTQAFAKWS